MADLLNNLYDLSEDTMQRLMKDLNYMFAHLDERNVKRLYTEYCNIQSEDGETVITGPSLYMRAKDSTTVRLAMGWNAASSEFMFDLYTSDGDPSLELDSLGNAVFKGAINTAQDIYVGNRVFVGWGGGTNTPPAAVLSTRGIYIMEPDTTKYMAAIYSTNVSLTTDQAYEFEIESSAPMNITSLNRMRIYMYAGYDGVNPASINSTDYLQVYAYNNRASINSMASGTTAIGTMIGHDDRSVFIGSYDDWYNKVISNMDLELSFEDKLKYYFMHNVRASVPSDTSPDFLQGCHLVSSTERISSTIGVRMYPLTTTLGYNQYFYNLSTPLDFENFNDGTALTSDDKLVMVVYLSSTSILSTAGSKFFVSIGQSSSICWNINTTAHEFVQGWNLVTRPFKADSIEGAPVISAVNWVKYGWYGGHSTSHYAVIDYVGVIRANSTDATDFNPFVRDYNSTNFNELECAAANAVMLEHNGTPAIVQLPIDSAWHYDLWLRSAKQDFIFEVDNFSMLANYSPILSAYIDSSNYVNARVSSGILRLSGKVNNSTFGRIIYCDAFTAKMNTQIKLIRQLDTWTASFQLTTVPMTYREITMYNGPGSSWENLASLYVGHEEYDVGSRITGIRIKPYTN